VDCTAVEVHLPAALGQNGSATVAFDLKITGTTALLAV
jgi:hypothetical protein